MFVLRNCRVEVWIIVIHQIFTMICAQNFQPEIQVNPCLKSFDVLISRIVKNEGFHRNIITKYDLGLIPTQESLHFLIVENMPAGIYVDTYEIASRKKFDGVKVLFLKDVDVESPAYRSSPFEFYIFANARENEIQVTVPVHMRYQMPQNCFEENKDFVAVTLKKPSVFFKYQGSATVACGTSFPCDADGSNNCSWIPLNVQGDGDLVLNVPVGCNEHYVLVTIVTFLTVCGGALMLGITLWKKSINSL